MFFAASLALTGCQSTPTTGEAPSPQAAKAAPSTFDLGKKKLFVTAKYKYQRQDHYSGTNKGSFTETRSGTDTNAMLIRQNGNNLLIADPDNQAGTVFVNDKSVQTSGSVSGKGKPECVKLMIEEGYHRNICSQYSYRNGILEIKEVEKDPAESRTSRRTYKIAYDGDTCRFISYTETADARNAYCDGICLSAYGGSTKWRYAIKINSVSGKCSVR